MTSWTNPKKKNPRMKVNQSICYFCHGVLCKKKQKGRIHLIWSLVWHLFNISSTLYKFITSDESKEPENNPETSCRDKAARSVCSNFQSRGLCETRAKIRYTFCRKTCGICQGKSGIGTRGERGLERHKYCYSSSTETLIPALQTMGSSNLIVLNDYVSWHVP